MSDLPPPPTSSDAPPPSRVSAPPPYQALPGSPGYMPAPIGPSSGSGLNLGAQIAGAGSSIGVGVVGIIVPIVWASVSGGSTFYFYVLPIFGAVYGVRALGRGFVIGGVIGIALNVVAGLVNLTAAGVINPG